MQQIFPALMLCALISLWGCGQKSHQENNDQPKQTGNQELYNEVMEVHDEVMPKMNDLYKLKENLKKRIADTPNMAKEKKKKIESTILTLDSASEGMMVWMRNFNPLPDDVGEEKAREYLEEQKEKVKKVKEDMLEAIEEAEAVN